MRGRRVVLSSAVRAGLLSSAVLAGLLVVLLAATGGDLRGGWPSVAAGGDTEVGAWSAAAPAARAVRPAAAAEPSPDERAGSFLRVRGQLDEAALRLVDGLPLVDAATIVRSETIGLFAATDPAGGLLVELSDGFRIPVAVTAIEPRGYAATLGIGPDGSDGSAGPDDARALAGLRPGEVLLTPIGAELRGTGAGATLHLGDRPDLTVAGVLSEPVGRAEVVVHADDAAGIGVPATGSLVVRHSAGAHELPVLARAVQAALPADRVRGVSTVADPAAGGGGLVLGLPALKARFGEFAFRPRDGVREVDVEASFVDGAIVTATVPLLGTVRCHRIVVDDLRGAMQELVDAGVGQVVDARRYGGCFHPRRIDTARARLSSHSWGIAVDINVDMSLPGLGEVPPDEMIEILGRHGFRWGGDFGSPDNHHWEWVGAGATVRPPRS